MCGNTMFFEQIKHHKVVVDIKEELLSISHVHDEEICKIDIISSDVCDIQCRVTYLSN
jgi:hypothetical protein